jgi:hypothetical protein
MSLLAIAATALLLTAGVGYAQTVRCKAQATDKSDAALSSFVTSVRCTGQASGISFTRHRLRPDMPVRRG